MKIFLQLLIAAIAINASTRAGLAAMRYYQLKDTAQQAVLFGARSSPEDIREHILSKAKELRVPLDPEKLLVRRQGGRTWADVAYGEGVELFPNQPYHVDFSFSVEGYSMVLGK